MIGHRTVLQWYNVTLHLSVNFSVAHEKCGWTKAAAGSRAQGSAASPAGEAGGSQTVAAGMQCGREWTFYSLNPWKVMGLLHLVSMEVQSMEEICVSLQDKVNQGKVSASRWTLVPEQSEGFSHEWLLWSLTDVCPETRDAFSLQCFKSVMVYQGGMIVEVNLGSAFLFTLFLISP